jgi:outer membrane protein assembly factor BamA
VAAVLAALLIFSPSARAEDSQKDNGSLRSRRYELAGFPIIAGNTDIGVQFGGAATLTRFYDSALPYEWNVDLLLSASAKDDQNGFRLVQQAHVLRVNTPDLFSGRLRLDSRASFQRTINASYYGMGNSAPFDPVPPPGQATIGRRYQYVQEDTRLRVIGRVRTGTPADIAFMGKLRYEAPEVYASSKLEQDLAARNPDGSRVAIGGSSMLVAGIGAGVMVDTRDSEFVTRRGVFYQVGVGAFAGTAEDVAYGTAAIILAHYAPLPGPFVFASRFFASFLFGNVPFYDLAQGGTFESQYMLGGESGVRGVPAGRYAGPIKMLANTEVRATPFPRFVLLGQRLRIGNNVFFDAGRVWNQYGVVSPADGYSLGLKFGIGAGVFIQWGEAAIFRIEAAYSPDAAAVNPALPLGIYAADRLMF